MSIISFHSAKLSDLEFSTKREILRTNHAGSYILTTLSGCNTRKYDGLLVCPIPVLGSGRHVLLSSLDETIIREGTAFNLSVRRYQGGIIEPGGSRYLSRFDMERVPKFTFRIGDMVMIKERLLVEKEQQLLIRYKLEESPSPVALRLKPFLAFRNMHQLSKSNLYLQNHYREEPNGISLRLYDGYPELYMQVSTPVDFVAAPDWYYNIEYIKEMNRGYEAHEDLYTPGQFELTMKKGDSAVFSASTSRVKPTTFKQRFRLEVSRRISRDTFTGCLRNAANQFIQYKEDTAVDIIAGFPWYNSISRQTFVALPGLRYAQTERRLGLEVLTSYLPYLKNGLFPGSIADNPPVYNSADASLWFIWTVQQLKRQHSRFRECGPAIHKAVREILVNYRKGTPVVNMLENGLLFAAEPGLALTWMDSTCNGKPSVPRYGKPVELNALWYNAVCFGLEMARSEKDQQFMEDWRELPVLIAESFLKTFWCNEKQFLADVETGLYTDWSVRPNMVIAAAMPYTPLSRDQREKIVSVARHRLLTPRGLRTLSPDDPAYRGSVEGSQDRRESASHNGAAFPWLIQFYAEACLGVYQQGSVAEIKKILKGFESEMSENCLGTVSEMYNGSPPHTGKGAVAQAWNVAALLYTIHLLENTEKG